MKPAIWLGAAALVALPQMMFYFLALLYQPTWVWILVPAATLSIYIYMGFSAHPSRRAIVLAATATGILLSSYTLWLAVSSEPLPVWRTVYVSLIFVTLTLGFIFACATLILRARGLRWTASRRQAASKLSDDS